MKLVQGLSTFVLSAALSGGMALTPGVAQAQEVEVEVQVQPPAPRVEVIPAAPSAQHFWIHGYWGWQGGAHVWMPGRYEVLRPGWGWEEAHWAAVGPRWHFYPGHWYHR
jgi:hypothetical protein